MEAKDNSDVALCPRCGNDSFNCKDTLGVKMVCSECEWAIDPSDMTSLTKTPQEENGNKITKEWVDA